MKKVKLVTFLFFSLTVASKAQTDLPKNTADLNIGIGQVVSGNLMYKRNFYLGQNKKIIIAPAARLGFANASSINYISAPFEITSEPDKVDSFTIGGTSILSAGFGINIGYRINNKLSVVFDIDVFGLSFGGKQTGVFIPGKTSKDSMLLPRANQELSPTSPNILLVGDNDRGTLFSALNVNYALKDNFGIKLGAGFLFTEYTSTNKLGITNNDRWRAKSLQANIGAYYNF